MNNQYWDEEIGNVEIDGEEKEIILSDVFLYKAAKSAKVGERVKCGNSQCSRFFIKKSYQQAFCCNKGRSNCKDTYHNRTAGRVERTLEYCRK